MEWNYEQPVEIIFGTGKLRELNTLMKERGYKKAILVADPFFVKNGFSDEVVGMSGGLIDTVYSGVSPNPDVTEVDACAAMIRKEECQCVVALGGGSALDLAKAASAVALTDESIRHYHGTGVPTPEAHLPLIAIPTTAGTGSEVTRFAVLSDEANKKKAPIASKSFYPKIALVDPALTYTVPVSVTMATGIDVLSHAIEGYWSRGHQPICDALAVQAIRLVFKWLPKLYENPAHVEAREKLAEASVTAGLAFALPLTTSSHACSFPLTNIYKIPHGEACGMTLDYFTRVNTNHDDGRIAELAALLGFSDGYELADAILQLKKDVGLRTDLTAFNLTSEEIDTLVKVSKHPNLLNNPTTISETMLYELYRGLAVGTQQLI